MFSGGFFLFLFSWKSWNRIEDSAVRPSGSKFFLGHGFFHYSDMQLPYCRFIQIFSFVISVFLLILFLEISSRLNDLVAIQLFAVLCSPFMSVEWCYTLFSSSRHEISNF